jgi:hypothetical protein
MSRHHLTERIWFGLKSEIGFIKMGMPNVKRKE